MKLIRQGDSLSGRLLQIFRDLDAILVQNSLDQHVQFGSTIRAASNTTLPA